MVPPDLHPKGAGLHSILLLNKIPGRIGLITTQSFIIHFLINHSY